MITPTNDLLKTIEVLNRDPKFKEVVEWFQALQAEIGRQTNLLRSTDDMLRSAGRYQQMEDILKYIENPSLYLGR